MPIDNINQTRVNFDKFIDYVPVASAINCAVDLIQKAVFKHKADNGKELSHYQQYIADKEVKDCLLYIVPFAKVIDKIKDKITAKIGKFSDPYGIGSRVTEERRPDETKKQYWERITLDELNKTPPDENIKYFLLKRMKDSSKTYKQITESNYQDWKNDIKFILKARRIFDEQYIHGNHEDRVNFSIFRQQVPEIYRNSLLYII